MILISRSEYQIRWDLFHHWGGMYGGGFGWMCGVDVSGIGLACQNIESITENPFWFNGLPPVFLVEER